VREADNSRRLRTAARRACPRVRAQPECASRAKTIDRRERVFFIRPQALEASSKNGLTYDGWSSGPIIYAYAMAAPTRYSDPTGLDSTHWGGDGRCVLDGPRNGNWCGKNWSGGRNPRRNGGTSGGALPLDSLDDCCMAHDNCWVVCDTQPTSGVPAADTSNRARCRRECDRTFVRCLNQLDGDCRNWPNRPRRGTEDDSNSYRRSAIEWFTQPSDRR
jgi:hypothetical protein